MTMIRCSECGRSISDRAPACIGCGAPISSISELGMTVAPTHDDDGPPLSRRQLYWRVALAALTLVLGVVAVGHADHPGGNKIAVTLATLLLISGLCWTIAAVVQYVMARRA